MIPSVASCCATRTGIGPTPGISHTSPSTVSPRSNADLSTRTTTVAGARRPSDSSVTRAASSASRTIASNASASGSSFVSAGAPSSNTARSIGSSAAITRAVRSIGPRISIIPSTSETRRCRRYRRPIARRYRSS